jgi:hypothetical protein
MNNYSEIIKSIYDIVAKEHEALSLATATSLPILPSLNSLPNDFWSAQLILLKIKDRLYEIAKSEDLLFNDGSIAIDSHLAESNPHGITPGTIGAASSESLTSAIDSHLAESNPHGITPGTIGAVEEELWQNANYGTGWTHYESSQTNWSGLQYRKVGTTVQIRGFVKRTTNTDAIVANLPINYRPSKHYMFAVLQSDYQIGRLDIGPDGNLVFYSRTMNGMAIPWLNLHNIQFHTI